MAAMPSLALCRSQISIEKPCNRLALDQAQTIGGLLLTEYGELPPEDTIITLGDNRFIITEVGQNRIRTVHWKRIKPAEPELETQAEQPSEQEEK